MQKKAGKTERRPSGRRVVRVYRAWQLSAHPNPCVRGMVGITPSRRTHRNLPGRGKRCQDSRAGDRSGLVLTIWEARAGDGRSTEQERERVSAVSGGLLARYMATSRTFGRADEKGRRSRAGVLGPERKANWMDGGHDTKEVGRASRTQGVRQGSGNGRGREGGIMHGGASSVGVVVVR